jgi:septum site-determining protein MinC
MFTLPVLCLLSADMDAVSQELHEKTRQAPQFFHNAPVVIDLHQLSPASGTVNFALLVGLLRGHGLIPVGIRGGTADQKELAYAMEMAVLADGKPEAPLAPPKKAAPEPCEAAKTVTQPVRSGQRVIAPDGDLIVVAPVSSGAELLAAGNIHVYGALRGRALAGVKGNASVRIFCQHLDAELVSIAGQYRVNEDLKNDVRGAAVQISLKGNRLFIEAL